MSDWDRVRIDQSSGPNPQRVWLVMAYHIETDRTLVVFVAFSKASAKEFVGKRQALQIVQVGM